MGIILIFDIGYGYIKIEPLIRSYINFDKKYSKKIQHFYLNAYNVLETINERN